MDCTVPDYYPELNLSHLNHQNRNSPLDPKEGLVQVHCTYTEQKTSE